MKTFAARTRSAVVDRHERGSQIVEFALMLPIFVAVTVGAFDFGNAFTIRDKLANSAREGARVAIRQSTLDLSQASPPSVHAIARVVVQYLIETKVLNSSCSLSNAPVSGEVWAWTFTGSCPDTLTVTVERGYTGSPTLTANGAVVIMTKVTVQYPARLAFFYKAARLLAPGANFANKFTLTASAVMQNLV